MIQLIATISIVALLVVLALAIAARVLVSAHTRPGTSSGTPSPTGRPHGMSQRAVLTVLTACFRLAIRAGIPVGPMMTLTVRGRSSGLPRRTLVDMFERNGRRWLVATHSPDANWVRNVRVAREGTLSRGHRTFAFTAIELAQQEAGVVLKEVLGPRLASRVGGLVLRRTLGVRHDAPLEEFVRAAASHPVFEITTASDTDRPERDARVVLPDVAIAGGLLAALVSLATGISGLVATPEWIAGAAGGALVAGLANHARIFGRR